MTSEGIERQSYLWTTGVSALDCMGSGLAMSMLTMKLEGVGEGMFTELAEDMVMQRMLLLWPISSLSFCTLLHL